MLYLLAGDARALNFNSSTFSRASFYLPGDCFGFECTEEHTLSAEVVSNAKVLAIKKSALAAAASRDAGIQRQILSFMASELARLQDRVLFLLKNAQERVGEFILDREKRAAVGNYVELPMLRHDIADYLGLTIETISRILTALEKYGAIEIMSRHGIVIRNHSLLKNVMADQDKMSTFRSYLRKSTDENCRQVDRRRTRSRHRSAGGQPGADYLGIMVLTFRKLDEASSEYHRIIAKLLEQRKLL